MIKVVSDMHATFDIYYVIIRWACSIQMEEVVILTGGYYTKSLVTVYNNAGFVEELPSLNTGRRSHGCGHFVNTDNQVVRQQHCKVYQ